MSAKVLAQAVQDPQEKEIVERRLAHEGPLRVEDALTQEGPDFERVREDLGAWARVGGPWAARPNRRRLHHAARMRATRAVESLRRTDADP